MWSDEGMVNFYVYCGQWKKWCGAPSLHQHSDRIGMKNTHSSHNSSHRLITIQMKHTISLRQKPKRITRMFSLCPVIQHGMSEASLGFCLRDVANEKPLKFEKTTSSVLYVSLLIYDSSVVAYSDTPKINTISTVHSR